MPGSSNFSPFFLLKKDLLEMKIPFFPYLYLTSKNYMRKI